MREELGTSYNRQMNSIPSLFSKAEGGSDISKPDSVMKKVLSARTTDGTILDDDPAVKRWLLGLSAEVNPLSTVIDEGTENVETAKQKLAEIQKMRTENPKKYWASETQAEELNLIEALSKHRSKG